MSTKRSQNLKNTFTVLAAFAALACSRVVLAVTTKGGLAATATTAGFSKPLSIYPLVANIISVVLGLCGLAFLVIIIWSGAQFFVSQGNADKIKAAKSTLVWAAVGLVVIISAYTATYFVFKNLLPTLTAPPATSAPGSFPAPTGGGVTA